MIFQSNGTVSRAEKFSACLLVCSLLSVVASPTVTREDVSAPVDTFEQLLNGFPVKKASSFVPPHLAAAIPRKTADENPMFCLMPDFFDKVRVTVPADNDLGQFLQTTVEPLDAVSAANASTVVATVAASQIPIDTLPFTTFTLIMSILEAEEFIQKLFDVVESGGTFSIIPRPRLGKLPLGFLIKFPALLDDAHIYIPAGNTIKILVSHIAATFAGNNNDGFIAECFKRLDTPTDINATAVKFNDLFNELQSYEFNASENKYVAASGVRNRFTLDNFQQQSVVEKMFVTFKDILKLPTASDNNLALKEYFRFLGTRVYPFNDVETCYLDIICKASMAYLNAPSEFGEYLYQRKIIECTVAEFQSTLEKVLIKRFFTINFTGLVASSRKFTDPTKSIHLDGGNIKFVQLPVIDQGVVWNEKLKTFLQKISFQSTEENNEKAANEYFDSLLALSFDDVEDMLKTSPNAALSKNQSTVQSWSNWAIAGFVSLGLTAASILLVASWRFYRIRQEKDSEPIVI